MDVWWQYAPVKHNQKNSKLYKSLLHPETWNTHNTMPIPPESRHAKQCAEPLDCHILQTEAPALPVKYKL